MKVEVNEKFFVEIEQEGTIMDTVDNELCFVYKDSFWCDYEMQSLNKKPCILHFGCKYDIPFFLLTIEDALDTSDFVFNPHECDEIQTFMQQNIINGVIYFIDSNNIVKAKKTFQLNQKMSDVIKSSLQGILSQPYNEKEFQCNLDGIMQTWEPFELAEMFKHFCKL